ncbi:MAG: nucleotidyl transferase AbiEii/AbiGii toxin family protein, partial [Anaerobutyricum hallii]
MDLDATIKGTNVSVEDVEMIISQIISIPLDDGVSFRIKRISEIMEEADYPGVRVSMETKFDGVITPLKIDISTGDIITPREIKYNFNLMLENRTIEVWAYNLETVLAEKLETVISRNVTNTRMRDFYDIYILQKLYGEQLSKDVLRDALVATAKKRETLEQIETEDIDEVFDEIQSSSVMENLWKAYQRNYSYSADIPWHTIMKSIRTLYEIISENIHGV